VICSIPLPAQPSERASLEQRLLPPPCILRHPKEPHLSWFGLLSTEMAYYIYNGVDRARSLLLLPEFRHCLCYDTRPLDTLVPPQRSLLTNPASILLPCPEHLPKVLLDPVPPTRPSKHSVAEWKHEVGILALALWVLGIRHPSAVRQARNS
jgi:hypothetical protein